MKFGPVPLDQAEGTILAHSEQVGDLRVRKGKALTASDVELFKTAGVQALVVAVLEPGDVDEDQAATWLAQAIAPDVAAAGLVRTRAHTGRVNLNATAPGLVRLDAAAIHAMNRIDPAITLATLPAFARVGKGTLVGTVKIISYAVDGGRLARAMALVSGALVVLPVQLRSAGLILSDSSGGSDKLTLKGRDAMAKRLRALGMSMAEVRVVPHDLAAMAAAFSGIAGDMVLLLTGSATSDLDDTGPAALRLAGGGVARFGMPVDPGNLLFYGEIGGRPVIGLPGCARSPALNGADWVLERMACGLEVTDEDIAAMGVGGLLKEIPIRPQPREI